MKKKTTVTRTQSPEPKRPSARLEIRVWTDDPNALPTDRSELVEVLAEHVRHVAKCCEEGYQSGEIVDEKFGGWWDIEIGDAIANAPELFADDEAKGRITAAGQELLDTLKSIREELGAIEGYWTERLDNLAQQADAVIAKAEGKQ